MATMCSGTEAPLFALREAGIPYRHVFAAETSKDACHFIQANFSPEKLYGDITELNLDTLPRVDLLVAGPPCQSFSCMNAHRLDALDPRVQVLKCCLEYIRLREPTTAIIENVPQLRKYWSIEPTSHGDDAFTRSWVAEIAPIISQLKGCYSILKQVLSPHTHANCPQSRRRLYMIFRKHDAGGLVPLEQVPCNSTYRDILDDGVVDHEVTPHIRREIMKAWGKYGSEWHGCGIDCASTFGRTILGTRKYLYRSYARCLIAKQPSFVIEQQRFLTRAEMLRLQGFPQEVISSFLSFHKFSRLVGNAMHVGVLKQLFVHCCQFSSVGTSRAMPMRLPVAQQRLQQPTPIRRSASAPALCY